MEMVGEREVYRGFPDSGSLVGIFGGGWGEVLSFRGGERRGEKRSKDMIVLSL